MFQTNVRTAGNNHTTLQGAIAYAKHTDDIFDKELLFNDVRLDDLFINMPGYVYWKNKRSEYMGCNYNLARISGLKHPFDIVGKRDEDFG